MFLNQFILSLISIPRTNIYCVFCIAKFQSIICVLLLMLCCFPVIDYFLSVLFLCNSLVNFFIYLSPSFKNEPIIVNPKQKKLLQIDDKGEFIDNYPIVADQIFL